MDISSACTVATGAAAIGDVITGDVATGDIITGAAARGAVALVENTKCPSYLSSLPYFRCQDLR